VPKPETPAIYRRLGVRPVIHGSGTTTRYGGSLLRPEVLETMREASQALVNLDELNEAAGAAIARMLGAQAAFVTAGASAGLILQAAACIAGADPAKITRLPDTRGMRNEIVIQRAHRFAYDQAYRVAGGVLVEIGLARRTHPSSSRTRSPSGRPPSPTSSRRSRARPASCRWTRSWRSRTSAGCPSSSTPPRCCRRART